MVPLTDLIRRLGDDYTARMGGQYQLFADFCRGKDVNPNEASYALICSCYEDDLRAAISGGKVDYDKVHPGQRRALAGAGVLVKDGLVDEARLNYFLSVAERLRR